MTIVDILAIEERCLAQVDKGLEYDVDAIRSDGLLKPFNEDWSSSINDGSNSLDKYDQYLVPSIDTHVRSTEEIVEEYFEVIEKLDAYGTSLVKLKPSYIERWLDRAGSVVEQLFVIYNTYGDEDDKRHQRKQEDGSLLNPLHYTPCIAAINPKHKLIDSFEVADLNYYEGDGLKIENRMVMSLECMEGAEFISHDTFHGKRAFYFDPESETLSLRCNKVFYERNKNFQDPDYSPDSVNVSSPRALFPLVERMGE